ncbi:MAG TPA: hypothetical protein VHQ65_10585 [Thermoanaerobaculia bacterium]|nr:hypothetical protein [Thermoanaerobaculia bacterium]
MSPATAGGRGAAARPCRCLRWKGMYVEAEPDPLVPNTSAGLYWCIHTMNCLGPDGRVAEPAACSARRGCFEDG